jgi:hypothetical protein
MIKGNECTKVPQTALGCRGSGGPDIGGRWVVAHCRRAVRHLVLDQHSHDSRLLDPKTPMKTHGFGHRRPVSHPTTYKKTQGFSRFSGLKGQAQGPGPGPMGAGPRPRARGPGPGPRAMAGPRAQGPRPRPMQCRPRAQAHAGPRSRPKTAVWGLALGNCVCGLSCVVDPCCNFVLRC